MPLAPTNKRYVTRVYGRRGSGAYRSYYVHRSAIPTGENKHVATTIAVGGDGYVFVYGYAPTTHTEFTQSAGSGTVTVQGYSPDVSQGISVGVGTVTITGGQIDQIAEQANQQDVPITRVISTRVTGSYSGGTYRRGSHHVVRRTIYLTSEQTEEAGVGTITIQGYAPTVSATEGELILPGIGTVTITGYRPGRVLQDLTYTGTWKDILRRYSVGTGAYRRDYYRKERRFLYFRTYPVQGSIEVGLGEVTITGYQVFLEPRVIPVGLGQVNINGLPPSPLLDDSVQTISTPVLEAIKQQRKRRRVAAKYEEVHRPVSVVRYVPQYVQPIPQRIIGVPNGSVSIIGYQAATQKRLPLQDGRVVIEGGQPTIQQRIRIGAGSVVIQGAEPALDGDIEIQINTGNGAVLINGYSPLVNAGGVVNVAPSAGLVTINGSQPSVQEELSIAVGSGTVTIGGAGAAVQNDVMPGAGAVTITGYAPTVVLEANIISVGVGTIEVQNLRIGLSIPEISVSVGSGTITIEGNAPSQVVTTGAWTKEDRKNTTWTKQGRSGDNWSKANTTSTTWTKL